MPAMAQDQIPAPGETAQPAASLIAFYRTYLSGVDGDRCPMHPSCSAYSLEAFQKHGFLMGWVMTCDRLMRCGRDEKHIALSVPINGRPRIYDPVSNNDFWWARD
jgi:putative component of membrane protein insertase Oxa1/YidC/SpoIIIJ protein YidD